MPFKVSTEDDPFLIGREMYVWFQVVVMIFHIHQFFRFKPGAVRLKQINPAAIRCFSYLPRVAAIAGKGLLIPAYVKMDRPLVTVHLINSVLLAGFHINTC